MQYVDSKLPAAQLARHHRTNGASAQALQQYFSTQQSKYEVRTARNVHIFDEKLGNVCHKNKFIVLFFSSFYLDKYITKWFT